MNKINIIITFLATVFFSACATYQPLYKNEENTSPKTLSEDEINKTFFLIGNTGQEGDEVSNSVKSLQNYISENNSKDSYIIFLGNSFYPAGMPPKDEAAKQQAKKSMQLQIDALKDFKGKVVVLPGNRDWKGGVDGLELEEDFLKSQFNDADVLQPNNGCPIESIDINDDVHLIALDTQWFLEDWDTNSKMNDKCQIKTRERLFIEIEGELKKNATKTIVFAMYHPLITYGEHGGKYPLIHKDFFSTFIKPVKSLGAISKQDRYNERYNNLMQRLQVLTKDIKRLVFVSGHDKSLQYNEEGSVKQIVAGSGSGATAAALGQFSKFSYGHEGFARLDVSKKGATQVTFYKAGPDGGYSSVYYNEIHPPVQDYDLSILHQNFPQTTKAQVYNDELINKSGFYKSLWGEHYREVYGIPVTAPTVLLDTLYGGLKVMRAGGGHQTRSLRLEDKDGRTYNMRALKKSAVQFLQTVIIKDKQIENDFVNTIPEELILDFYTAAHPYGAFTIPKLAEAANILHTKPKLYFVPKQFALGNFNENYGDELYMIVERPDETFTGPIFNYPDDMESTDDLFEKLREDEKYTLDEKSFVRARVFDMLVGDWDRHADQWRFTEHKNDDGSRVYEPIPRDRDQVYSNFDGALLDIARTLFSTARQFQVYSEEVKHTGGLNLAGIKLDRALVQRSDEDTWLAEAQYIKNNVSDAVIDSAFKDLPVEVQGEVAEEIKQKLKARRDNIVQIAEEYYEHFAKLQTVTGTDKDDYFEITRLPEGKTNIKTYRIKDGEKGHLMLDRTFHANQTKQIWVYGLDDDDVFEIRGKGNNPIFIRIIGGQNNDTYKIANGRNVKVYDQKSKKNTIEEKGGASIKLTDNYDYNTYDFKKEIKTVNLFLPTVGYNPDDGFKIGPSYVLTQYGFKRNPFSQQHSLGVGYYSATSSFEINYQGEFANIFGSWNFLVNGHFKNPNFSENYFGFGNETINPDYEFEVGKDYNRVRIGGYGGSLGIKKDSPYGSVFQFKAKLEGVKVEATADRYITQVTPSPTDLEQTKYFATAEGSYQYQSFDNKVNPSRGMDFSLVAGGTQNIKESDNIYGYVHPRLVFYSALSHNRKLVLKTDFRGQFNIGNNFEFYQGAQLGSDTGLRAYRDERFTGRTAAVGAADLRYSFNKFKTALLPVQIGIFGGYDVGRVWVPNDTSDVWHSSYGGGFWINSADLVSGTFNLFTGDEGMRFTFGLALSM
ncbi:phosphoesterase [Aequorivita marisscotiae]|uniref:Phosphoesterase n=1 Tax=Aequorivita marisscotiae TaxID=3040348 RepID=A0ABY8KS03_9FLAO|nr:phosphoesterase [Aequorivita sp. Ant34-E75]WGF92235.1 phosphoesterase [Aequorivita sp. Ant34-E75]